MQARSLHIPAARPPIRWRVPSPRRAAIFVSWILAGLLLSSEGMHPIPRAAEPSVHSHEPALDADIPRERAILEDATLFPVRAIEETRPILNRILSSAGRVEEATIPLSPPFPSLHAVLQAHGAPDHVFEQGEGHVHVFGHVGLVAGDPRKPDHVTGVWLQGRNYALRAAMDAGNTFRESTAPDGRTVRVFYIRTREAARWERVREGVWRELGGSLLPGIYHRHWDESTTPESIHVANEKEMARRLYYRNGRLYQEIPLRNAAWNGISRVYYPSGRVERELPLQAGRLHGDVVTYAPDGTVTARIPYREGVRHGVSRTYHPNGATRHAVPFENGVMHGTSRHYSVQGRLIRETPLVDGKPSGVEKEYGMDGTLRRTQVFRDGVPVGEAMRFSRQGRPLPRMAPEDFGEIDSEIAASPAEVRARQRVHTPESTGMEGSQADASVLDGTGMFDAPGQEPVADPRGTGEDSARSRRVWRRVKFWGEE